MYLSLFLYGAFVCCLWYILCAFFSPAWLGSAVIRCLEWLGLALTQVMDMDGSGQFRMGVGWSYWSSSMALVELVLGLSMVGLDSQNSDHGLVSCEGSAEVAGWGEGVWVCEQERFG